jgi:hypothetical protein
MTFRALFCTCLAAFLFSANALALTDAELESIGRRVWKNECGGRVDGLTSWNEGEGFASLGIGHFIWYPKGVDGPYEESFPELLRFLAANGTKLPDWLSPSADCPWNSRAEFNAAADSARMKELRTLLAGTVPVQSRFLARRMERALPKLLAAAPAGRRDHVKAQFQRLAATGKGTFALIDYVNFKGEGTNPAERYKGEGWGLLQVLDGMDAAKESAPHEFGESAARVLARRVKNAEPRDESRWLKGWQNRVRAYGE